MNHAATSTGLRADAARNRQRIVDAAREVFARDGLDVSMRQVALHAGVGEPTLRRRFATKADLVAEVFQDKIATYADAAEAALDDPDVWRGFSSFVYRAAGMQLADRGFTELLTMTFPKSMRVEQHRLRAYTAFTALIARAQSTGVLREDFVAEDLPLVLIAHAGVVAAGGEVAGDLSARLLAYLLQAFAAPGVADLPPAPSPAAIYRALLRLHSDAPAS
ncbi:TetR family transcriptional regulator [Planotetraspora thailandica]|uniref:TetR family transcriptional regulator n=1 Tax=Planotetraspora thailandica TaxID=487172 RepID=A0A8J3XXK2_9ACTN|nr:TetR/AcrR family transcriptional regulator [Planotetraspora thailandica]GII56046.1 TetR family transcriptional regulator [Planotetraspora thailandica]